MGLRRLKSFVVLAEALNFNRAAARLHISQPPLTRQIQLLEGELGAPLFERQPKGLVLTAAGCALLDDARRILGMVAAARDRAAQAGRGEIGRLDVGIFGSAILRHIPRLLLQFRSLYPNVQQAAISIRDLSGQPLILYPNNTREGFADHVVGCAGGHGAGQSGCQLPRLDWRHGQLLGALSLRLRRFIEPAEVAAMVRSLI